MDKTLPASSRRQFLGATVALTPLVIPSVLKAGEKKPAILKVGLVGCGGRGSGAASQALTADANITLHAIAEVDTEMAARSLKMLADKFGDRVDVPKDRMHFGLDAYKKVVDSCDVVILATPPGFRPEQLTYAVDANKHIFCEKPVAVDAAGYRVVLEAIRKSKEKNLCIVSGFCWRRSASRREAFDRLHKGEIGEVRSVYSSYYTGPVKPMPPATGRTAEMSDVEWQIRNWYNFGWLSGDSLVEQAIHSVDKVCWAFGDVAPIAAVATGGRQIQAEDGNIYDHFHIAYEYPNGAVGHLGSRQITGCHNETIDTIHGTKGTLTLGKGPNPYIEGENKWRFRGNEKNMYQVQHDELFAAIRKGEVVNDGDFMLSSSMVGILGRMAAYTGKRITWEQAIKSDEDLAPDTLKWGDSFKPAPMARPGQTIA